jgi:hypothetical protein
MLVLVAKSIAVLYGKCLINLILKGKNDWNLHNAKRKVEILTALLFTIF